MSTRTWSVPTSPRSPYKIPQDLRLLSEFEGQIWNKETQTEFGRRLSESETYEGQVRRNLDFAARDRINRSPKTFGFVTFGTDRIVQITPAGKSLLDEPNTEDLFTRQLLKWQYPSPNHKEREYIGFCIKPFLEILRLARDLDGLTKREIAIFCIPLIDYHDYENVRSAILTYRTRLTQLRGPAKNRFIKDTHNLEYRRIFAQELRAETLKVRENRGAEVTPEKFIQTKVRGSMDYADSAIRYFRATGLFKLSATTFRLQLLEQKNEIVASILDSIGRDPVDFSENPRAFLELLGNPSLPTLPDDRPEVLQQELRDLVVIATQSANISQHQLARFRAEQLVSASASNLKTRRRELETLLSKAAQQTQASALQSYELYDDVISMYDKIVSRSDYDIPDKPLFFEWNTWRAFAMLDDGDIVSNAGMDVEGKPLNTAPGGGADGICYYRDFALAVEVTLARGARQFEAENESVPRHVGKLVSTLRAANDERPVFGIFIASGLNPAAIAHFYSLRRTNIIHYGGHAKILPLDLSDFKTMLEVAKNSGGTTSEQIHSFLQWVDTQAQTSESEVSWHEAIRAKIPTWLS